MASADYMREWRARSADGVARQRRANNARHRAYSQLRKRHRAEFDALYNAERAREGLPPVAANDGRRAS